MASGGSLRHKPNDWLRQGSVEDMTKLLLIEGNPAIKKSAGRYGGTYVCKELVYSYAMWVSAEFSLKVIRTFDRVINGDDLNGHKERYEELSRVIENARDEQRSIREVVNNSGLSVADLTKSISTNPAETEVERLVASFGCMKLAKKEFVANSDAPTTEAARKRFERAYIKCKEKGLV